MPDSLANPGTSRSLVVQTTVNDSSSKAAINQLRGLDLKGSSGSGIPKQVTNVGASIATGATGSTSTVRVTFHRDPSDKNYGAAAVWVKGYQGNSNPVQVASSYESPATFVLNNTGEPVSILVQSVGNGGAAPLNAAPTTGLTLPKSVSGGYGTNSTVYVNSVTAPQSGLKLTTAGQGWFAGPGIRDALVMNYGGNAHIINIVGGVAANNVIAFQFVLESTWKLSSCSYKLSGVGGAGSTCSFGIYDANGNRLIDTGTFDGTITTLQTKTFTAVTLSPGVYYFACSSTSNLITGPTIQLTSGIVLQMIAMMTSPTVLYAQAANSVAAGVMPATLGALSAISNNTDTIPVPIWKV